MSDSATKRMKYAWAKYYESVESERQSSSQVVALHRSLTTMQSEGVAIPTHFVEQFKEMADALHKKFDCPVCLEFVEKDEYKIENCGHIYCKTCSDALHSQPDPKCAICRRKFR
jgi:hypothetical protein